MSFSLEPFHLAQLPRVPRVVLTLFVLMAGIGYGVAMLNLYYTYAPVDGKPGLSAEDLKRSFYGNRDKTVLAAVVNGGSMEQYLQSPNDKGRILSWIQDGATREGFDAVQPIFQRSCVRCHVSPGSPTMAALTSFEEVQTVTQIDRGESLPIWARVAHTHLQAIALIFLALGLLFAFCTAPEKVKLAVVVTPFLMLLVDFGSRALARIWPSMVYVMMISGGLMGLATAIMIVAVLYELWFGKPKAKPDPVRQGAPVSPS
jgi:hypothetical protein